MTAKSSSESGNTTPANSSIITVDEARERCKMAVFAAFEDETPILVDALPAMGKSRSVVSYAEESGNPVTILTERHHLYRQFGDWCEKGELTYKRLPSFHHDCPTAAGDHGQKWQAKVVDLY